MNSCRFDPESRAIIDLMHCGNNTYMITRINVPSPHRGKGIARRLLQEVLDEADEKQVRLILDIVPSGGLTYRQLRDWYRRRGFVSMPNTTGRNAYEAAMVREPRPCRRSYSQDPGIFPGSTFPV